MIPEVAKLEPHLAGCHGADHNDNLLLTLSARFGGELRCCDIENSEGSVQGHVHGSVLHVFGTAEENRQRV